ncbi:MAG: DUF2283 domain-containing protein [Candidatus Paceibacterota bacterium]|jgi:uncharacterized protein YuzE
MKISYDTTADALYIKLREGKFLENEEPTDGVIFDIGEDKSLLGIEILEASKKLSLNDLSHIDIQVPFATSKLVPA